MDFVGAVLRAANQNPMIAGGDHTIIQRILSARLFPHGETTSAQSADNGATEHLQMKCGGIMSEHGIFCNIVTLPGQIGSAQRFATLAGG